MRVILAVAAAALFAIAPAAARAEAALEASGFDKPRAVKRVDLGPADTVPPQRKEVRCSYFEKFMVKEVDEREIGAAQLSILPVAQGQPPPCRRDNLPEERVVDDKAWTGYFDGAHGNFSIFRAGDGAQGGMGFAVVRPADAAVIYTAVAKGELRFGTGADGTTLLRFAMVHAGDCSVELQGKACAEKIGRVAGVAAPDTAMCRLGYAEAKRQMAHERCAANAPNDKGCAAREIAHMADWDGSPSVISYAVEVALGAGGAVARPTGPPIACWPAD